MSASRTTKNNVLAGIFVLTAVALGVATVIVLSDVGALLSSRTPYVFRFPLSIGAEGLQEGSEVSVGGRKVGRVAGMSFFLNDNGAPTHVDVRVKIRSSLALYENASVLLHRPLLGAGTKIDIPNVGDASTVTNPGGAGPRLEAGEVILGTLAPPAFLAQAGYGPDQAQQVQNIIRHAEELSGRLNDMTVKLDTELDPRLATIRSILDDVKSVTESLRDERWPDWSARAERILDSVERAAADLEATAGAGPERMDEIRAGIDDARQLLASVQDAVDDNRPNIDRTIENVAAISDDLRNETYTMVMDLLEGANEGVDEFVRAGSRAASLLDETAPQMRTMVANARLASDQLKLTLTEVRAAPWRLLYQPGRKEFENELLFESVRTYAEAVSDLRATAGSLDALLARDGEPSEIDRRSLERLNADLVEAFERYQEAGETFIDQWIGGEQ